MLFKFKSNFIRGKIEQTEEAHGLCRMNATSSLPKLKLKRKQGNTLSLPKGGKAPSRIDLSGLFACFWFSAFCLGFLFA
jgi:hypothetical protein